MRVGSYCERSLEKWCVFIYENDIPNNAIQRNVLAYRKSISTELI